MIIGTVRWFNPELGFGFIKLTKSTDAFVHYSSIKTSGYRTLSKGDIVKFDIILKNHGYAARNVIPMQLIGLCDNIFQTC